jgi:hypothetical protein
VVESVTTVEKLTEVLDSHYSTIAVVNLFGSLIGLIPKNFVIVLLENHWWYEEKMNEPVLTKAKSHRPESVALSNEKPID